MLIKELNCLLIMYPGIYQIATAAKQTPGTLNGTLCQPGRYLPPRARGTGRVSRPPAPRDGLTCSKNALSTYLWKAPNASAPSLYKSRFWGERLYKEAALSVGTPRATGGQVACDCGSSAQPLGRNGSALSPSGRHAAPHLPLLPPHFLFLVTNT